jgi:hypothetical protein
VAAGACIPFTFGLGGDFGLDIPTTGYDPAGLTYSTTTGSTTMFGNSQDLLAKQPKLMRQFLTGLLGLTQDGRQMQ